jgi:hypothetical protein
MSMNKRGPLFKKVGDWGYVTPVFEKTPLVDELENAFIAGALRGVNQVTKNLMLE